jgi:hypothetical protein
MSMMRKAQRRKAKLRLGISGPAGGGKTYGALLVAYGITGDWDKICLIDTENHSGELYASYNKDGVQIGEYNYIAISQPYTPDKYIAAIKECEAKGIECVIIDSLTHAWSGEGGLLDKKGQIERSGKPGVNGWTAWRDITPQHNRLVESIISSTCHIIATLRAKMEYVQEKDSQGKTIIRKIGMNPIQRDGMEYEFTTFVDVDQDHQSTASKDRTSLLDGKLFTLSFDVGRKLAAWLDSGTSESIPSTETPAKLPESTTVERNISPYANVSPFQKNAPASQKEQPVIKWDTFYGNVKNLGFDEAKVKEIAAEHYKRPVESLKDVIDSQQELNKFMSVVAKHKQQPQKEESLSEKRKRLVGNMDSYDHD